jgi:pimeloyl-ACP methyl ester carboxylesterase
MKHVAQGIPPDRRRTTHVLWAQVGGPMNIGKTGYTQFKGVHMVDGAGHWAHEEQPEQVGELLIRFLCEYAGARLT